jgi:dynactin complex subunit
MSVVCDEQLGCTVVAGIHTGILRYLGPAQFAPGDWAGVELDHPGGKNDGTVNGVSVRACVCVNAEALAALCVRASGVVGR